MLVLRSKNWLRKDDKKPEIENRRKKKQRDHDNVYLNPDPINLHMSEGKTWDDGPLGPSGLR